MVILCLDHVIEWTWNLQKVCRGGCVKKMVIG